MAALVLVATVPACAPANTGSTVSARGLGGAAHVSYGTIVGSRPVQVQGGGTGVGTIGGAAAGGIAGSFIGGDWRSRALAGLGGALVGGLAGTAVERGASSGHAIEFIVREDRGGDIAVVQTNEEGLQVGDRVVVTRGDRVRLSRAAGAPPPGYAPAPGMAPQSGYAPQAGAVVSPVGGPAK
jgi:outer membrane lipoprotein SlyB